MGIQVELKPEVEAVLQRMARDSDFDVSRYIERLIERDVLTSQTFDQILAPVRKGFAESGMSETELNELLEQARDETYQERNTNNK
jgi:hypothetical protein